MRRTVLAFIVFVLLVSIFAAGCKNGGRATSDNTKSTTVGTEQGSTVENSVKNPEKQKTSDSGGNDKTTVPSGNVSETAAVTTTSQKETTTKKSGMRYSYDHVSVVLPPEFEVDTSEFILLAAGPDYPEVKDNISFLSIEAKNYDNVTQSLLDSYYRNLSDGFQGSSFFAKTKVSGKNAIKYIYGIVLDGVYMTQTQYLIFGGNYVDIVTFTSVTGEYDAEFDECARTITVQ